MDEVAEEALTSGDARSSLFPRLLMKLLNDEVAPDSLWWLPDGLAFCIDPDKIPSQVLDQYFRGTKYSSFIRRLHNAGFRRRTRYYRKLPGLNLPGKAVALSHDCFVKGKPELLERFNDEPEGSNTSQLEEAKTNHSNNSSNSGEHLRSLNHVRQLETASAALSFPAISGGFGASALQPGGGLQASFSMASSDIPLSSFLTGADSSLLLPNLQSQLFLARHQGRNYDMQDLLRQQQQQDLIRQHQQQQQDLLRQQQQQQQYDPSGISANLRQRLLVNQQQQQQHLQRLQQGITSQRLAAAIQNGPQRNSHDDEETPL